MDTTIEDLVISDRHAAREKRITASAHLHIFAKLGFYRKSTEDMLQQFDQHTQLASAPIQEAPLHCKDTDDQAFIDLAYALVQQHPGQPIYLISKDKAVLSMRKRLTNLSIHVGSTLSN